MNAELSHYMNCQIISATFIATNILRGLECVLLWWLSLLLGKIPTVSEGGNGASCKQLLFTTTLFKECGMIKGRVAYLSPICCNEYSVHSEENIAEVVQDIDKIQNLVNLLGSINYRNMLIIDVLTPYVPVKDAFTKFQETFPDIYSRILSLTKFESFIWRNLYFTTSIYTQIMLHLPQILLDSQTCLHQC